MCALGRANTGHLYSTVPEVVCLWYVCAWGVEHEGLAFWTWSYETKDVLGMCA